jgi:hypothetical protein
VPGVEFVRLGKLSGQHFSVPRPFLRELGIGFGPGNREAHAAVFRAGRALLVIPLRPGESIEDALRIAREACGGEGPAEGDGSGAEGLQRM